MSYMLQVFAPPEGAPPEGPREVSELVDRLQDALRPRGDTRYRQLVRMVKAAAAPDQVGEWMAALAEDDPGPVFNIAVDAGRSERTVQLVVRCARTLQLAVLDPQAAVAYWPDGRELRFPPRARDPSVPDAVKPSDMDPPLLAAGAEYILHCAGAFRFTNETHTPELLPKLLAENTPSRPGLVYPPFVELEQRLARRFGRDATATAIWARGLPAGSACWTVYSLAVKPGRIREARPGLLALAHSVGLSVFDPHAAQIHTADGRILWRGAQWYVPGVEGRLDPDGLADQVAELAAPALAPFGFAATRHGTFLRRFGPVEQEITFYSPGHWDLAVNVIWRVVQQTDLPAQVMPRQQDGRGVLAVYGTLGDFVTPEDFQEPLYFHPWGQGRSTIGRRDQIEPTARETARVLVERVLPYFEARRSIAAIHAAINGPGASADRLWPLAPSVRLGIAHLAGTAGLSEMAAGELAALRAWKYDPAIRCLDRQSMERETEAMSALLEWLGTPADPA
jgi:hypothetical protein